MTPWDFFPFFIFLLTFLCPSDSVPTSSGLVVGDLLRHGLQPVTRYLGIPYAKPPLGDLRFRKPVPYRRRNSIIRARQMRPGCVQFSPNPFITKDDMPGLSEDCLYLNVWAPGRPSLPGRKRTVMFWIHSGGFVVGSSRLEYYDGLELAARGDVVVVTVNHRLGAQGFLYSASEDAPGNVGLWDLVEALKWVRENIGAFGGDKDSITLFGNSAGGIAIGMFCVSNKTRGLFKRAIMQSGTPTTLYGADNSRNFNVSQQLAVEVDCAENTDSLADDPKTVVECLRNVDPFVLARALQRVTSTALRPFYPQFDDALLPKDPRQAVIEGDFQAVDLLIGTNDGDGASLITQFYQDVFGFFGEKDPQINKTFGESIIRDRFRDYRDPDAVVQQYLGDVPDDDYETIRRQVFNASGDYERICPSVYFAESFAARGAPVYYYYFTRPNPALPYAPWMLAVHFVETPYVFGRPFVQQNYTNADKELSKRMIQAWSDFAKTGVPSKGAWPLYSRQDPTYQLLDVGPERVTGRGPHRSNCDFFRSDFGF